MLSFYIFMLLMSLSLKKCNWTSFKIIFLEKFIEFLILELYGS